MPPALKRPAAAAAKKVEEEEEEAPPPPEKKAKGAPKAKAKAAAAASEAAAKPAAAAAPAAAVAFDPADPLALAPLFDGQGHGRAWEAILRPVLEKLPDAAAYIGPGRDRAIVPVRELTFQALKPNPPSGWRVVSLGQSPFPRIESATGIAHFDNAVSSWEDKRFGSVTTMRCIIKAAAMHQYGNNKEVKLEEIKQQLKDHNVVQPAEWFQAMLAQGVLFMNAACTLKPPGPGADGKSQKAGTGIDGSTKFWAPVIEAVVDAILEDCGRTKTGVVFAWWGGESLKTKKVLDKGVFKRHAGVKIKHVEHANPAAMGDGFCNGANVFGEINKALKALKHPPIDWLPSVGWQGKVNASAAGRADAMGDFIAETQALHKMYLERLKDGLDGVAQKLQNVTGIMSKPLLSLADTCKALGLEAAAKESIAKAKKRKIGSLTLEEAAAVHFYTTNHIYRKLNAALRSQDRAGVTKYFSYLRLLLEAVRKMSSGEKMLYRGVDVDLSAQYPQGQEVCWWAVSSCTPDLKVAKSFGGGAKAWTLFCIKSSRSVGIKHLSEYQNEEEFILAPGTEFKVTKVVKTGKSSEVHMEEIVRECRVN